MPDANTAWTILATVLIAAAGGGLALWRGWLESPQRREDRERNEAMARQNEAIHDVLLGEAAVPDRIGGELIPERPGLVKRTEILETGFVKIEDALTKLTETIAELADIRGDVAYLKAGHANHDAQLSVLNPTVAALVSASAERAATADAAAAMLRLAADRDALIANAEETS